MSLWRSASRRLTVASILTAALLLAGCGPRAVSTTVAVAAPAFPEGCGPQSVVQPAATAIPASTASTGQPLAMYGAAVPDHSLTAAAGVVVAFAGSTSTAADPLYVSRDAGLAWTPLALPPGVNGSLDPVVVSANGRMLAGTDGQDLYVTSLPTAASTAPPVWTVRSVENLGQIAFDPTDDHILAGLGADTAGAGILLYLSDNAGKTLTTHALPLTLGHGQALVVTDGMAVVAIGQAKGPVRLFAVSLAGGTAPTPPQPPAGAVAPAYGLTAGPGGTLYLATGGGLFALAPQGGSWTKVPAPQGMAGATELYVAAGAHHLYITADGASGPGVLWRGTKTGGDWAQVPMSSGYVGQPVPDGAQLWVPTDAGPVRVGASGSAQVRVHGIAATAVDVASAAWRPTEVAAGWSGGLYFSANGGLTWTERTPPGNPIDGFSELAWTPDGGCIAVIRAALGLTSPPKAYVSGNAGRTWWAVPLPGDGEITGLTESPPASGVWWVAETGSGGGLYRSAPGTAAWTKIALPAGAPVPIHLASAPGGVVWRGSGSGLWRIRVPAAAHGPAAWWARLTHAQPAAPTITRLVGAGFDQYAAVNGLAADPYDSAVLYNGVRRTVDGGATWAVAQPGSADVVPTANVGPVTFGPLHPGALITTGSALVRDDGTQWVPVWKAPPGDFITGIAPAGPGRFYVAVQHLGLIVVSDAGASWKTPAAPPGQGRWTAPPVGAGQPLIEAASPSAPATVYRITPSGALEVSHDGGRTFPAVHAVAMAGGASCCTPPGPTATMGFVVASALAVSPLDPRQLYVGLALQGVQSAVLGLWTSSDGGQTWERSGLPENLSVEAMAAVPATAGTLYAVAYPAPGLGSGPGGLWRTVNGGKTWSLVSGLSGPLYSVATPTPTEVLVGGGGRIWRSTNSGSTFSAIPLNVPIWAASGVVGGEPVGAILQTASGTLFAGTDAGVAESRDGGQDWQVISEPVGDPAVLSGGLRLRADGALAVATQIGAFTYRPGGPPG